MPLTRKYADVLLDNPADPTVAAVEHHVEIRSTDQMRAELEGKVHGISLEDSLTTGHLWAWAALVRTKVIDLKFKEFREVCVACEIKAGEPVDPTQPAASDDSA